MATLLASMDSIDLPGSSAMTEKPQLFRRGIWEGALTLVVPDAMKLEDKLLAVPSAVALLLSPDSPYASSEAEATTVNLVFESRSGSGFDDGFGVGFGVGGLGQELAETLGTLRQVLQRSGGMSARIFSLGAEGAQPVDVQAPDLSLTSATLATKLATRERIPLPPWADELMRLHGKARLSVAASVAMGGTELQLRFEGAPVGSATGSTCVIDPNRTKEPVRAALRQMVGDRFTIDMSSPDGLPRLVDFGNTLRKELSISRPTGKVVDRDEFRLEGRVLWGKDIVDIPGHLIRRFDAPRDVTLTSQFPARWSNAAESPNRFIDVIQREGATPWVVELKPRLEGGSKRFYHGAVQAALYAHFLRTATPFHSWFESRGMDATTTRAAIAVSALGTAQRDVATRDLTRLVGEAMGVSFGEVRRRRERGRVLPMG